MYVSAKEYVVLRTYIRAIAKAFKEDSALDVAVVLDMITDDYRIHKGAQHLLYDVVDVLHDLYNN